MRCVTVCTHSELRPVRRLSEGGKVPTRLLEASSSAVSTLLASQYVPRK